jgi:two-component system, chemotaxis family, protein-glutamate methylesterase/glutaminase
MTAAAGGGSIRVVVVDDSAFMRTAIKRMLESEPRIRVVATGTTGREGVDLVLKHRPDVVTMDVEMPDMDGLTALRRIMASRPTHVIMVSSLTTKGSRAAITALRDGAADVFAKDKSHISTRINEIRDDLVARVVALAAHPRRDTPGASAASGGAAASRALTFPRGRFELVCIASSTGGPPVLETLLTAIPRGFELPVVVAQHMPEIFTRSMAERFADLCAVPVRHIEPDSMMEPGVVHICPGGSNTHLRRLGRSTTRFVVDRLPEDTLYYPSANVLFSDAAKRYGASALAVVCTGMGDDGLRGARELHAAGGVVLAQSEETCVVYGMPKAVTQDGLVEASPTPAELAATLAGLAGGTRVGRLAG